MEPLPARNMLGPEVFQAESAAMSGATEKKQEDPMEDLQGLFSGSVNDITVIYGIDHFIDLNNSPWH